jgi:hypothetical protein
LDLRVAVVVGGEYVVGFFDVGFVGFELVGFVGFGGAEGWEVSKYQVSLGVRV